LAKKNAIFTMLFFKTRYQQGFQKMPKSDFGTQNLPFARMCWFDSSPGHTGRKRKRAETEFPTLFLFLFLFLTYLLLAATNDCRCSEIRVSTSKWNRSGASIVNNFKNEKPCVETQGLDCYAI
jgi:hypothetical protein